PRGWAAKPLESGEVRLFRDARQSAALWPLVVHSVYLINLAAQNPSLLEQSRQAFAEEIRRSMALGADYLVVHPGSPGTSSPEVGIGTFVESIGLAVQGNPLSHREAYQTADLVGHDLTILIENAAGQGSSIGRTFEELADILAALDGLPVGICLDTAHTFAAGYDISTSGGLKSTLLSIEKSFGLERIKLIHCNDSKVPLGSRVDRHQHIGLGHMGDSAFRRLTRSPLRRIPFVLETPIEKEGDDERNLTRL